MSIIEAIVVVVGMFGSLVAFAFVGVQTWHQIRGTQKRERRLILQETQAIRIHEALQRGYAPSVHEHDVRPVAVVIRGESVPVRWICPECGEEVSEPEPLGPVRNGGTMAVGNVIATGTIEANKIETGSIQTLHGLPKTEAEMLERLEHLRWHNGPGAFGIYSCCMFVGTTVADEIYKIQTELERIVDDRIAEPEPKRYFVNGRQVDEDEWNGKVRDGWRRERDGSWTQAETPKVTELAVGEEKPLESFWSIP